MKYIIILLTILFLSIYMIVSATELISTPLENTTICDPNTIIQSGATIYMTEIGFDGTDEWIELTNIGDQDFSGTILLSGVKSSALSYNIMIPSLSSLIIGDSLTTLTGDIQTIIGQGFSIPDTTGFTISLIVSGNTIQQEIFDKNIISNIPNTFGLEMIFSGYSGLWLQTAIERNINTLSPTIANPGELFCYTPPENTIEGGDEGMGDIIFTGDDEIFTGEDTPYTGDDEFSGEDVYDSGGNTGIDLPPIDINPPPLLNNMGNPLPCIISEIHPGTDRYVEYIEFYCEKAFSGVLSTIGIGVGETKKDVFIKNNGGYTLVSSSMSGFYTTGGISILAGISLRDDGETITLFTSGYITGLVSFPATPSGKSFYPLCGSSGCIGFPSPGFSEQYLSGFVVGSQIQPLTATNTISTTTPTSTSTYYQDLYNKRKTTATTYQKENTLLKKEKTSLTSQVTSLTKKTQKVDPKITPKTTKQTTTTAKKTTSNTPKTQSSTAKPKATTTKTTKTPTVSTTSKAYVKLVDEHKLYKNYITFVDKFLKTRLYTQYSSLGIGNINKALATSLKAVQKQQYTLLNSGSTTGMSVFDFNYLLSPSKQKTDSFYISLYKHYKPIYSTLSKNLITIFLAKHTQKDTLTTGKIPLKNDIGNDITDIKTSEMSFLH